VIVEALIFDGDDRGHEASRHALERHVDALLTEDGERLLILGIEHRRGLHHRPDAAQRSSIRHGSDDPDDEPDSGGDREQEEDGQDRAHRHCSTAVRLG
jgi:hypothetical protein